MTTSLKPIRFNKTPTQGMWVVDVEGYGELAVVHNTEMRVRKDSGERWIESNYKATHQNLLLEKYILRNMGLFLVYYKYCDLCQHQL